MNQKYFDELVQDQVGIYLGKKYSILPGPWIPVATMSRQFIKEEIAEEMEYGLGIRF